MLKFWVDKGVLLLYTVTDGQNEGQTGSQRTLLLKLIFPQCRIMADNKPQSWGSLNQ